MVPCAGVTKDDVLVFLRRADVAGWVAGFHPRVCCKVRDFSRLISAVLGGGGWFERQLLLLLAAAAAAAIGGGA